jgi:hypothetical protein
VFLALGATAEAPAFLTLSGKDANRGRGRMFASSGMAAVETRHDALLSRIGELGQRTLEQRRRSAEAIGAAQALVERMRMEKHRLRAQSERLDTVNAARAAAGHAARQTREVLGAVARDLKQPLHILTMAVDVKLDEASDGVGLSLVRKNADLLGHA